MLESNECLDGIRLDLQSPDATNPTADDSPVLIFMDKERRNVLKCCSTSSKPITVVTHQFDKCKSAIRSDVEGGIASVSFKICNYLDNVLTRSYVFPNIIKTNSSIAIELASRKDELNAALKEDNRSCHCMRNTNCATLLVQNIANLLFGIFLLAFFWVYGVSISSGLPLMLESGVQDMILLLNWLMGAPAGLKLNYKLTAFLGRFFMYHIWLWSEYLRLAGRYFNTIFIAMAILGLPGGASLQLACMQDVFQVFLLHIYCFYIYSCRLFLGTKYLLQSLWRLFRGLKWNLLRERVDHASYDSTQLFIGTLVLAIVLFTLPTVFLYYLVFATLRSIVLIFFSILDRLRYLFSHSYVLFHMSVVTVFGKIVSDHNPELVVLPMSADNITVLTTRHGKKPLCGKWHKD